MAGEPVVYWYLPSKLPEGTKIKKTPSTTGDYRCHKELHCLPNNQSRNFYKDSYRVDDLRICEHEVAVSCSEELLIVNFEK